MECNYGCADRKGFEATQAEILFALLLVEFGHGVGFNIDEYASSLVTIGTMVILDGVYVLLIEKFFVSHDTPLSPLLHTEIAFLYHKKLP